MRHARINGMDIGSRKTIAGALCVLWVAGCGGSTSDEPVPAPDCAVEPCTGLTEWTVEFVTREPAAGEGFTPAGMLGLAATPPGGAVGLAATEDLVRVGDRDLTTAIDALYFGISPHGQLSWHATENGLPYPVSLTTQLAASVGSDGLITLTMPLVGGVESDFDATHELVRWEGSNRLWTLRFDEPYLLLAANRGGTSVVARYRTPGELDCEEGTIVVLDASGRKRWGRCPQMWISAVAVDEDDRVYAAGTVGSVGLDGTVDLGSGEVPLGVPRLVVIRWSFDGNVELVKDHEGEFGDRISLDVARDGSIWLAGRFYDGTFSFGDNVQVVTDDRDDPLSGRAFVARIDPNGTDTFGRILEKSARYLDSTVIGVDSLGQAVLLDTAGYDTDRSAWPMLVIKLSPAGDEIWRREDILLSNPDSPRLVGGVAENGSMVFAARWGLELDGHSHRHTTIVKLAP